MTNKEAIAILTYNWKYRELIDNSYQYEALDLAIKSLEDRPQGERAERALSIIDRLRTDGHINNKEQGTLRRAILLPERQHGKWIKDNDTGLIGCSRCHLIYLRGITDFCPNCGAYMRGDNNE